MSWFIIALIGPILWAIVNHIDKYLLSRKLGGSNIGALMIFSTIPVVIILPILYLFNNKVFEISTFNIFFLVFVGVLSALAILPYMYALEEEEASIVIPLFQLIPIWGYIFSYYLLGEILTITQLIGCLLIVIGSTIITIEIDAEDGIKFKRKVIWLMLLSTVLFAVYETLFKFVAISEGFVISSFWEYVGVFIFGVILYLFAKNYRISFIRLLKLEGNKIILLNLGSESLTIVGNLAMNFALILAPVAMTLTVSSIHPLFVFIIGVLLTIFFPDVHIEKVSNKHLVQKIVSIIIIIVGSILIL